MNITEDRRLMEAELGAETYDEENYPNSEHSVRVDDDTYLISALPSEKALLALSTYLPGMLFPNTTGYTHRVGSNSKYYIVAGALSIAQSSRAQVEAIVQSPVGLTFSSQARALAKYICAKTNIYSHGRISIMRHVCLKYNFQYCLPFMRRTENDALPLKDFFLYDLRHAYMQMLRRMPSPFAMIDSDGTVRFSSPNTETSHKWMLVKEYLDTVAPRDLRLAFVGSALAPVSKGECVAYTRGRKIHLYNSEPYAVTGVCALAVRATYEVVAEQVYSPECHQFVRYANIDSIGITDPFIEPERWKALGLEYSLKAEGAAEIISPGRYRIRGKEGQNFDTRNLPDRCATEEEARRVETPVPDVLYYRSFLGEVCQ